MGSQQRSAIVVEVRGKDVGDSADSGPDMAVHSKSAQIQCSLQIWRFPAQRAAPLSIPTAGTRRPSHMFQPISYLVSQTNKPTASIVGLNAPISSEGVHQELIEIDIPETVAGTAVST